MAALMTKKVYKGTDLQIQLILKDAEGNPYRINKTNEFIIKFFTTDPEVYVEASYSAGEYTGIIEGEEYDYVVINSTDLDKLEDGLLNYVYNIRFANIDFEDGFYDEVVKGETNLFLKSKFTCNE